MAKRTTRRNQSLGPLGTLSYDLGSMTPAGALLGTAAKAYQKKRKKTNPAKFDRCVKAVQRKGGAANAYAVCTAAMKKKNTAKLQRVLQKKAVKFRRNKAKMNPEDTAAARYEYFHGRPPAETVDVSTPLHTHSVLSGIGKLLEMQIFAIDGSRTVKLAEFKGALLCQDEKGNQLYIEGGDQAVNCKDFGIREPHELEILGALTSVVYFTRKDHLRAEDGGTAAYDHKFGTQRSHAFGKHGSRLPLVGYDVRNKLLSIQGGGYELPSEGIDG